MKEYDVTVIGGGPAGLAAAISAKQSGAEVLLIERENALGGILKQCIHDGFGIIRFDEKLSGPEYAERFIKEFEELRIDANLLTFVSKIEKVDGKAKTETIEKYEEERVGKQSNHRFDITLVNCEGLSHVLTRSIIFATGCRERTSKQAAIHGTRPAGVYTAGNAQHFINLMGEMVTKKCVILGSGDIGLIMARRLTLEGAKVLGVYEAKPVPSGLARNIKQCLVDYDIPLHLSHTVTRVFGHNRLEAVEVAKVDKELKPIAGTEERIECDALILSVGLIPENELAEMLGVEMDPVTRGPKTDLNFGTSIEGVFSCGNAHHVYDLVDHVSVSGEKAGKAAADYVKGILKKTEIMKVEPKKNVPIDFSKIICVGCPKGCAIEVKKKDSIAKGSGGESEETNHTLAMGNGSDEYVTFGNTCPRGHDFAVAELTDPKRTISSTVKTEFEQIPMLPVRLTAPVSKERIFDVMREINKVIIKKPVKTGDILIANVLGLGSDVIAASTIYENRR